MKWSFTNDKQVDHVLDWLMDYRMYRTDEEKEGLLEGLTLGAILAIRHPEYLHALAQLACAAEDIDLEDLPDGHSWLEHGDLVDLLVEKCPLANR